MYIRQVQLVDFRSWQQAELALDTGVNVIVGHNGKGKTNLVEALGYASTLSSHRVSSDAPLVRHGAQSAVIRLAVVAQQREVTLELQIAPGKSNRARINRGSPVRAREVLGILRTVVFAPEDLALVRGDPGERRRFLDDLLVSSSPRFAGLRSDYDRVLRQRGALLKSLGTGRGRIDESAAATLETWDGHMAAAGAALLAGRIRLVQRLAPLVAQAYAAVAPESAAAGIVYRSSLDTDPEAANLEAASPLSDLGEEELEQAMLAELARVRARELERGVCLIGPHRDDLELRLGPAVAKGYASHGESWSMSLALRLASFRLLAEEGSEPVLVLDDVFAELDRRRRAALAAVASEAEQVVVTAAVAEDVPEQLRGRRFVVGDGEIATVPEDSVMHITPSDGEVES